MKLFLLIFLVFLPGLSISSPPWTLTTQGYGPIRPGMTPREAGQLLKSDLRTKNNSPLEAECGHLYPVKGHRGISLMIQKGRITRMTATTNDVATKSGVRVGDPEIKLRSLFGESLEIEPHKYDDTGKYYYIWEPGKQRGVKFEVIGGRIQSIHAGDESISLVEGCS
jgi:hypothetical protein